ncbi:nitronate monooxygenase, partial [Candidatus Aerophobetes bacterium]|nr:nitronate monooxygenase [Candidatus Aerophobetes bacterium]
MGRLDDRNWQKETIIALTPAHVLDPQIAIAAIRAGKIGILDLGYKDNKEVMRETLSLLTQFARRDTGWGIRWDTLGEKIRSVSNLQEIIKEPVPVLVLGGIELESEQAAQELKKARLLAQKILIEACSLKEAEAFQSAGYDGLIIKGNEAGGRVGSESSFILLQKLYKKISIPYWIQGGIGLYTSAAALVAGARGVVLCEQLWLTKESPFSSYDRMIWEKTDGTETICIGQENKWFRCFKHSGKIKLRQLEVSLTKNLNWQKKLNSYLLAPDGEPIVALGQDIAFAGNLAKRFATVGCVLTAMQNAITNNIKRAKEGALFTANSPLSKAHNTFYPIVQGPMARISDTVSFCEAVAKSGALPFLSIGLMQKSELQSLLAQTKKRMGNFPWGVGILGFLPPELRKEQSKLICKTAPPFAIIAGGYPAQAKELEAHNIATYLHVPSPALLETFIRDGARKFIFEGRESGGHVGPLASFILWEKAIDVLLQSGIEDFEKVQILFAGGIHSGLSSAMIAAIATPLHLKGMKVGLLMGTAYLFTREAVATKAVSPEYQAQAIACKQTTLLEIAPGRAIRCTKNSFIDEFTMRKKKLIEQGKKTDEIHRELGALTLGRLRIAAKGTAYNVSPGIKRSESSKLIKVNRTTQRKEGLFLMGEVASLREKTVTMSSLHTEVSQGSRRYLDAVTFPQKKKQVKVIKKQDIAIVGMACMFPEAANLREYWQNIINRVDAIHEVDEERWKPSDFFDPDPQASDKTYSKWGGFLKEIQLDPTKYGIPPISVPYIEPMQLLALEVAWRALEDAGYNRREFPRERTSVIFGVSQLHDLGIDYVFRTMLTHYLPKVENLTDDVRQKIIESLYDILPKWTGDSFPGFLGNIVAGRVANRLNLGGSNFTVDAACASSLAGLEVATKQLQAEDCDVALVG